MQFRSTSSCAWQEIGELRSHKTPKDAMIAFCKANLTQGESRVMYHTSPATQNRLYSFYLFSAAIKTKASSEGSYLKPEGEDYGSKFAEFLTQNKLGNVIASPLKENKAFHEDHSNKVWIWTTDQPAIEAWWKKEKETNASLKAQQEKELSKMKVLKEPTGLYTAYYYREQALKNKPLQPVKPFIPIPAPDDDYELPDWEEEDGGY